MSGRPAGRILRRVAAGIAGVAAIFLAQGLAGRVIALLPAHNTELRLAVASLYTIPAAILFWSLLPGATAAIGTRRVREALLASAAVLLPVSAHLALHGLAPASSGRSWALAMVLLLPPAASEEIMFRGFLQDLFSTSRLPWIGLGVSALLFAWVHSNNPSASLQGIVNIGLFGVFLGLMRLLTRGLVFPILFHWLWNGATGCILGAPVSGLELPSLLRPRDSFEAMGFGPEEWPFTGILILISSCLLLASVLRTRRAGEQPRNGEAATPGA
ncbi:CPBP family intramembrane metalloprotease [Candidatus Fermentibacterales bacterium]|nr:CPBP family intramembrane metalloprotease [Candidatus Fermentibacterales bacterium]